MSLLTLPPLHTLKLSSPFLTGEATINSNVNLPPKPTVSTTVLTIRAMKTMQGRVVCTTNNKTVAVEVTRLAPHPKYKRRVRKKKTYQAHDETNEFRIGDYVVLQKSKPISKKKHFVALRAPERRTSPKAKDDGGNAELGLKFESEA